jgi:diguanylate cyclase (GGDEF)-like protein
MHLLDHMQPRDHRAAARTVSTLCAVAVAVTVGFAPLAAHRPDSGPWPTVLAGCAVVCVAVLSGLARFFDEANRIAWAVCPIIAVAAIVVIDLLTFDASVSAQIFFLFPTLYGASLLRRTGTAFMTAASLVGELIVVASLPLREAVTDFGYVAAALVTAAVLLSRASEQQERLVDILERQAAIDPLTGLFTRRVLDEAATSALSGAGSHDGTSLILLDVDGFKVVNDRHGHPAGDELLMQLAALVNRRPEPGEVVCRMGGDEIALLLPGSSMAAALRRAEAVRRAVRAGSFLVGAGEVVTVSVSVGLAHAPTHADTLRQLYAVADAALYRAKQSGRNRVITPEPEVDAELGAQGGPAAED